MPTRFVCCFLLVPFFATLLQEEKNPLGQDPVSVAAGRQKYMATCSLCHGQTGGGGRGFKLADSQRIKNMNDREIFEVIRNGVPGTEMYAFPFADDDTWELVSFIRSLNANAIDQNVSGNESAGEELFFGSGRCGECHMIRGRGGFVGPDLSDLGNIRSARQIEESIRDPNASIVPGFSGVTVVTRDGRRFSGLAKNHSNYSIQLLDSEGNLRFFPTYAIKEVIYAKNSLMPEASISAEELQDLLAFLSRQSIER